MKMFILILLSLLSLAFGDFNSSKGEIEKGLQSGKSVLDFEQNIERLYDLAKTDREKAISKMYEGRVYFEKKDYDNAVDAADDGIDFDEGYAENHFWRGKAYLEILKEASFLTKAVYSSKSLSSFERAVELDPTHIAARLNLAGFYQNAPAIAGGDIEKAKEQYLAVITLNEKIAYAHAMLGKIYEGDEDFDKAKSYYSSALKLKPDNKNYAEALKRVEK